MKYKYAKRIAIYSIVFGIFSFFTFFSVLPPGLHYSWYVATFVFLATFIVGGVMVNRKINQEKHNILIPMTVLFMVWGLMLFAVLLTIMDGVYILTLLLLLLLVFPLYSGIKYIICEKEETLINEELDN